MRAFRIIATGAMAATFAFGAAPGLPIAWAQSTVTTASVDAVIATGDGLQIAKLIAGAKGDATATALIASILLASAQSTIAAGNIEGGAALLVFAIDSGGLTGASLSAATQLAGSTPAIQAAVRSISFAVNVMLSNAINSSGGNLTFNVGTVTVSNPSPNQSSGS